MCFCCCFFFNDPATTEFYTYGHTLSRHVALPICDGRQRLHHRYRDGESGAGRRLACGGRRGRRHRDRRPAGRARGQWHENVSRLSARSLGQQALRAAPDVGPIMRGEAGLMADLKALSVPFAAHEHVAVFTVAESDAVTAVIPGAHTKNLFLKDAAAAFWLVTVPADRQSGV